MRPNLYNSLCCDCHDPVSAGEGFLAGRSPRGAWLVRCKDCAEHTVAGLEAEKIQREKAKEERLAKGVAARLRDQEKRDKLADMNHIQFREHLRSLRNPQPLEVTEFSGGNFLQPALRGLKTRKAGVGSGLSQRNKVVTSSDIDSLYEFNNRTP